MAYEALLSPAAERVVEFNHRYAHHSGRKRFRGGGGQQVENGRSRRGPRTDDSADPFGSRGSAGVRLGRPPAAGSACN